MAIQSIEFGECDLCRDSAELFPYRDPDEGSRGRKYDACRPCIETANRAHSHDHIDED